MQNYNKLKSKLNKLESKVPDFKKKLVNNEKSQQDIDKIEKSLPEWKNILAAYEESGTKMENEINEAEQMIGKSNHSPLKILWNPDAKLLSFSRMYLILAVIIIIVISYYPRATVIGSSIMVGIFLISSITLMFKYQKYSSLLTFLTLGIIILFLSIVIPQSSQTSNDSKTTLLTLGFSLITFGFALHTFLSGEYVERKLDNIEKKIPKDIK